MYQKQGLLSTVEESEWRAQIVLSKFGASDDESSETEPDSTPPAGTSKEDMKNWAEEEEDEEEIPLSNRKRLKMTVGNRGSPAGPKTGGKPVPVEVKGATTRAKASPDKSNLAKTGPSKTGLQEVDKEKAIASGSSDTGMNSLFGKLIHVMGEIQSRCVLRQTALASVASLVGGKVDSSLPEAVANCIHNPDEDREKEARFLKQSITLWEMDELMIKLRGENQLLKKDRDISLEEVKAARILQEDTRTAINLMTSMVAVSGDAMAKAKLFDECVHREKKISKGRVAQILAEFAGQMEASLEEFRKAAKMIDEGSKRLHLNHPVSLSGISFLSLCEDSDVQEVPKLGSLGSNHNAPALATPVPAPAAAEVREPSTLVPERVPDRGNKEGSLSKISKQLKPNSGGP